MYEQLGWVAGLGSALYFYKNFILTQYACSFDSEGPNPLPEDGGLSL